MADEKKETIVFNGVLINYHTAVIGEDVYKQVKIKVTEDTSVRSFPNQFKRKPIKYYFDAIASNDLWSKIDIPMNDYLLKYHICFADLEFDARLMELNAVIKHTKDGTPFTEYVLTFLKDKDKEVDSKADYYIKHKEENEDGKKVVVPYPVTMVETDATATDDTMVEAQ